MVSSIALRIFGFACFFLAMFPMQYFAFVIYSKVVNDNAFYFSAYNSIRNAANLPDAYKYFVLATGAAEPISFAIFSLLALVGVEYELFVLLLNASFVLVLYCLLRSFKLTPLVSLFAVVYYSTDFYLLVLFSEVHRLKIAFIVMMFYCISMLDRRGSAWLFFVAILTHFQFFILLPVCLSIRRHFKWFLLIAVPLGGVFFSAVASKIHYYSSGSIMSSILAVGKIFPLFIVFATFSYLCTAKLSRKFLFFTGVILFAAALVGAERITVIYIEISMCYLFYLVSRSRIDKVFLLGGLVLMLSLYNIPKMNTQLEERIVHVRG